ncbi:Xanthine dehydrogenase/oxidase [Mycena sanguinolenta]|uniref:xanthine dehydrogenase n=1 Tax=Mycena sanguinolenta TaxID=230812 RepID=A0A8H7CY25_9AGAR|nr:Xanthine dehydrogenase/oxidase [Mycena sanguinolenta]
MTTTFQDFETQASSTLRFFLNGTPIVLDGNSFDPDSTLLDFIRSQGQGFTGTKLGCGEGGCGACTVVVQSRSPSTQQIQHLAVNACLAPIISVDGKHVITIEGVGSPENPHPIQERLWRLSGSQCGFCTPGIIMSLYALVRNAAYRGSLSAAEVELDGVLDGNLCRCTGYKPILDAAKTFVGEYAGKLGGSVDPIVPINFNAANLDHDDCCATPGDSKGCGRADCCQLSKESSDASANRKFPRFQLKPYKVGTELIFPPSLTKQAFSPLKFGSSARQWLRPTTLGQLLAIKAQYPDAKLVGGSTEIQIEVKIKAAAYPVSVFISDIAELRGLWPPTPTRSTFEFGANLSLADLEVVCKQLVNELDPQLSGPIEAVRTQLRYFAGLQIRNVASVGGNIATASPISDLNPVWVATDAKVLAATAGNSQIVLPLADFFTGYRKTTLPRDAVIVKIIVPINDTADREVVRAYKQAKRRDDDIAIVTTCFAMRITSEGKISHVRLAYGGMAATVLSAKKTEKILTGKPFSSKTLEEALEVLGTEMDLPFNVPGGMASYRKTLALSFFFKFWNTVGSEIKLSPDLLPSKTDLEDITTIIHRQLSAGKRDNSDPYAQEVVGRQEQHLSGLLQATGAAVYVDDMPKVGNEVYGALVLSTRAHAKIISVNTANALEMEGVVSWVSHVDLPDERANWWGVIGLDEVFFAVDEVVYHGQPIGMIVAQTKILAQKAARAVRVEYEDLPRIMTLEEAIEQQSFHPAYKRWIKRGRPIQEALATSDHVLEGQTRMGGQEHFYLETMAVLVVPKLENGEMDVYSSTQDPTGTQRWVSVATGVPRNRIVAKAKRLGGGFGGKESRAHHVAVMAAVAAKKTRRPVRIMLDRQEDIMITGQRHPCLANWKVGFSSQGKLQALSVDFFCNAGHSVDLSGGVSDRALAHLDNCYFIPDVDVQGLLCKTNTVSNTAFRGFGGPQGMLVAEHYIEAIAEVLNLNIDHVRQINLYGEAQKTHYHQKVLDWHVPRLLNDCRRESHYDERRAAVDRFNKEHKWRKRGIVLIPTKFGLAFGVKAMNQGSALVHVYMDGSVLVAHGGVEMGQGLYTKCCQIAAQELRVPLKDVFTSETASNTIPNTVPTAASAGSDLNGYAVFNACAEINRRLEPYRKKLGPDATLAALAAAAWGDRVSLSATGHHATPTLGYEWNNPNETGNLFHYFTQGVCATEVEVDTLTGDHTVLRVDIHMDVGKSLNPAIDYGQMYVLFVLTDTYLTLTRFLVKEPLPKGKGCVQLKKVFGYARMVRSSRLVQGSIPAFCGNSVRLTLETGAYKLPGFSDIPQVFNVSLLRDAEWPNLGSIKASKGVGEPPLFLGCSVALAIRDALRSARRDVGLNEMQDFRLPLTSERIRLACGDFLVSRGRVEPKNGEKDFFVHI